MANLDENNNFEKRTFLGKFEIHEQENEKVKRIKHDWNKFVSFFWIIFLFHIAIKGLVLGIAENTGNYDLNLTVWLMQIMPFCAMVYLMGYYGYKLSNKKRNIFYGLFGFVWIFMIGIF